MAAWIAGGAVALLLVVPATARACDAHATRAKAEPAAASADEKLKAEAGEVAKETAAKQPEQLAEKCKCDGPADCTCKKGQCQCNKCSKPNRRYRVMESLRDEGQARERPVRRNAAAGSFI
ncbi:MAG TPA: metallothionein [Myxococcaceae bacterium]